MNRYAGLRGGLRLESHKTRPFERPLVVAAPPEIAVLALDQGSGEESEPVGPDEAELVEDAPSEEPGLEAVGPWDDSDDSGDSGDDEDLGEAANESGSEDPSVEDAFEETASDDAEDPLVGEAGEAEEPPGGEHGEAAESAGSGPTADAEDVPLFQTPAPPAQRPTGKPSVPSFDDILFGPGPGK